MISVKIKDIDLDKDNKLILQLLFDVQHIGVRVLFETRFSCAI